VTFRFEGHYFGDQQKYMPKDRLAAAIEADPIPRYRERLIGAGVAPAEELDSLKADATAQVEAALAEVKAADPPGLDELDTDVYFSMEGIPR
jgi:pyruvate dehydrogenase E1 component alpha subunit